MSLLYEQRQKESSYEDDLGHSLRNVGQSQNHEEESTTRNLTRKYLVLLHDCLAIKFVPLVTTTTGPNSHPFPFAFDSNRNYGNNSNNSNNHQTLNYNIDHQRLTSTCSNKSSKSNVGLSSPVSTATSATLFNNLSTTSEVDHSLHGLYLYKGFREANLKCYWNSALHEAFRNLEYRGYIVPSIVLVWAIPRFFTTLRTAWSRQMLRSPPGFRVEFIGEIEELIADPIQQSQFAPLSDSLCWAILEITSMGQEAFVDSILQALNTAFPKMVQPNKELVYSTLEKLTRERKVYQTSQGYFVVTPDTFRYMISSNSQTHSDVYANCGTHLTLDALINQHHDQDPEKESLSRHSWDSTASAENPVSERPTRSSGDDEPDSNGREPRLRRHNSLKIIRQKDNTGTHKGLGSRSMSFRLYKSKSVHNTMDDSVLSRRDSSPIDKINRKMQNLLKPEEPPRRNSLSKTALGKFRKLFKKSNIGNKQSQSSSKNVSDILVSKSTASTQTPAYSVEKTKTSPNPSSPDQIIITRPIVNEAEKYSALGHFTLPFEYTSEQNPCWNSIPPRQRERPSSRQSVGDEHSGCHLYAMPASPDNFTEMVNRPQTLLGFPFHRGESSRCSTLSQGTSLGYGSQGQGTSLQGFTSQSPSPSSRQMSPTRNNTNYSNLAKMNTSPPNLSTNRNYKNYYDYYRRRYPTYTYAGPNTKPISHYEIVQNKMPEVKTEKLPETIKKTSENTNEQVLSTTTTVNSTTNMELELLLPLGKLGTSRKMQNQGRTIGNTTSSTPIKTQVFVGHPKSSTEVKTTVNHNGTIETHFDCDTADDSNNKSRVQIKVSDPENTDVILVNQKTGAEKHLTGRPKINGFTNEFRNGKFHTATAQT